MCRFGEERACLRDGVRYSMSTTDFLRMWVGPESPSSGAAEEVMGFIQRARLIEERRRAAHAVAAARGSNELKVEEPLAPGEEAEHDAPARRLPPLNYLGNGTAFEGETRTQGDLKIDGEVMGVIHHQDGCLTIGADAKVEADLVVRDVVINGLVEGNVDASGKVEIHAGGAMRGDLRAQRIQIHDGAVMVGMVDTGEDRLAGKSPPLPKRAPAKVQPKKPGAVA